MKSLSLFNHKVTLKSENQQKHINRGTQLIIILYIIYEYLFFGQ